MVCLRVRSVINMTNQLETLGHVLYVLRLTDPNEELSGLSERKKKKICNLVHKSQGGLIANIKLQWSEAKLNLDLIGLVV